MKKTRDPRQGELHFTFYQASEKAARPATLEGGSPLSLSDFDFELRKILKQVLADHKPGRARLAEQMTARLGREITKNHIDGWTAMASIERRIHTDALKAVCEITEDYRLMRFMAESCGFVLLTEEEAALADYGSKVLFKKMLDQDLRRSFSEADKRVLKKRLTDRLKGGPKR